MDQTSDGIIRSVAVVDSFEMGHQQSAQGRLVEQGGTHFGEFQHAVAPAEDSAPQKRRRHDVDVDDNAIGVATTVVSGRVALGTHLSEGRLGRGSKSGRHCGDGVGEESRNRALLGWQ